MDVKTKSCDLKYPAALGDPATVAKKRQKQVNDDYHKRAAKLDEKLGTAAGSTGPFEKELNQYGKRAELVDRWWAPSQKCLLTPTPSRT